MNVVARNFFFFPGPPPLTSRVSKPALSKSMSMDVIECAVMEDEYVEMDTAYPTQAQDKPVNPEKPDTSGPPPG